MLLETFAVVCNKKLRSRGILSISCPKGPKRKHSSLQLPMEVFACKDRLSFQNDRQRRHYAWTSNLLHNAIKQRKDPVEYRGRWTQNCDPFGMHMFGCGRFFWPLITTATSTMNQQYISSPSSHSLLSAYATVLSCEIADGLFAT